MQLFRTKLPFLVAALAALVLAVLPAQADDWTLTGSSIRVKTVALFDVNVYAISHYMKKPLPPKAKAQVINADVSKRFVWKMLRDVDNEKIHNALKDAFAMNGYTDAAKIKQFLAAFSAELKEDAIVTITYNADKKATTVTVGGGGTATVEGIDFMKGVWRIWFGKIDQPKMGDELISKLP